MPNEYEKVHGQGLASVVPRLDVQSADVFYEAPRGADDDASQRGFPRWATWWTRRRVTRVGTRRRQALRDSPVFESFPRPHPNPPLIPLVAHIVRHIVNDIQKSKMPLHPEVLWAQRSSESDEKKVSDLLRARHPFQLRLVLTVTACAVASASCRTSFM